MAPLVEPRMSRPQVSVIIPYYNEAEHLEACLRSLLGQRGLTLEILAIDDGSTDASPAIVARLAKAGRGRLRPLAQDHQGPGAARNLGARLARAPILAFIDADMTAAPGYLSKITAPIRSGKEDGTFVVDELVANPGNRWARAWTQAHGMPEGRRIPLDMPPRANTYRAIRRDKFLAAGGHHEERGVGEDEMDTRRVKPALAVPGAVLYHSNPASAEEVWLSARWFGRGNAAWVGGGRFLQLCFSHCLPRSVVAALWGGLKHRSFFYVRFKLIFDASVFIGLLQGRISGVKVR
jgi:glycosyltransferase involved in cell wall biosynthesis